MDLGDKWILLIEDEEAHAEAVRRAFKASGNNVRLTVSGSLREARQRLEEGIPDLMIVDWLLPDGKGTEMLSQGYHASSPVIVMTSHGSEALAVEVIKAGALDYVVKSDETFREIPRLAERALREWDDILRRREARGIVIDITPQKKAEEALQQQVSFLQSLLNAIPNPVFFKTVEGRYLGCNENFSRSYGIPREDMVGKSIGDLVSKRIADLHRSQDLEVLRHRDMRTYEAPAMDALGRWRRLLLYKAPFFNVDGSPGGVIGVIVDVTEREEALAALRTSEANLAEAQRIAHLGSWDWNLQTQELFCSTEINRIFGFSEDCLAPTSEQALEIVHPEDRAKLTSAVQEAVEKRIPLDTEHRVMMPDGTVRFVRQRAEVLYGEDGQPVHITGTAQDITQAKEMARELEESRQSFASIVENSTDGILVVDAEGVVRYANPAATSIFGRDRDELVGSSFGIPLATSGAGNGAVEIEVVRLDGNLVCAEMRSVTTTWNAQEARLVLVHDVTDRKRYDEALKLSEERMRLAIESSPIGTKIVQKGKYHYVNPAFVRMFGYDDAEEMLGQTVEALYLPEDREAVKEQEQSGWEGVEAPYFYERRGLRKDGTSFEVSVWLKRIEFGGVPSILGFAIDMSQEKALRAQLLQAQKMEALGTLSGGIAHDFNNILTIVSGYTELLLSEKSGDSPEIADLQRIATAASRGAELVQRMLAFSRRAEWKPRPLNLNEVVTQVVKLLARTIPKMIDVETELAEQLGAVLADGGQIEQVLVNLALNARDAMPDGGKLTFQSRNVRLDESYTRMYPGLHPGDHVVLSVSDTGAGMESETLEHIFDPFFTTKGPGHGTGLGLAVVYGIVKQHEGAITCYSQPGEGTTFNVYLPAIEAGAELPEEPTRRSLQPGHETILLVDDEQFIRDLGQRILTKAGYTVITATSGKEALVIYSTDGTRISLVILDLVMPEMSGRQCLQEILGMDSRAEVLIASGLSGEASRKVVEEGAKGYVSKPYDMNHLIGAVREILDSEG